MTRSKDDSLLNIFKKLPIAIPEYEVWVLGTWQHDTGHATVRFVGTEEECVAYRKASSERSKLSIRPTGEDINRPKKSASAA